MADITQYRRMLADAVADLPGEALVTLGPSEYGSASELTFIITITVGRPGPDSELVVDNLFNDVPVALEAIGDSSLFTARCSGHRMYADTPSAPVKMGAEWTVKILI